MYVCMYVCMYECMYVCMLRGTEDKDILKQQEEMGDLDLEITETETVEVCTDVCMYVGMVCIHTHTLTYMQKHIQKDLLRNKVHIDVHTYTRNTYLNI